jgi:hypothetical protein
VIASARRFWKASRNRGFSCTVSARALICGIFGMDFANHGTSPQRHHQLALIVTWIDADDGI